MGISSERNLKGVQVAVCMILQIDVGATSGRGLRPKEEPGMVSLSPLRLINLGKVND